MEAGMRLRVILVQVDIVSNSNWRLGPIQGDRRVVVSRCSQVVGCFGCWPTCVRQRIRNGEAATADRAHELLHVGIRGKDIVRIRKVRIRDIDHARSALSRQRGDLDNSALWYIIDDMPDLTRIGWRLAIVNEATCISLIITLKRRQSIGTVLEALRYGSPRVEDSVCSGILAFGILADDSVQFRIQVAVTT